ncbi:MAG: hypothetical protein ABSF98_28155 [Bryobacteraceae bacterium]
MTQKRLEATGITVPVPLHHPVRRGTLLSIVRQSGLPRTLFETEELAGVCRAEDSANALATGAADRPRLRSCPEIRRLPVESARQPAGLASHPVDIERALNQDWVGIRTKRDLQLAARAHVRVQKGVDRRTA